MRATHLSSAASRGGGSPRPGGDAGTVTYTITDLGSSVARAINGAGQVAGASNGNAVIWKGGVQTVLGSLGGDSYSYAINKAGQMLGIVTATAVPRLRPSGTAPPRLRLGSLTASSYATGINNAGQVVGVSYTPLTFAPSVATIWNGTTPTALGSLSRTTSGTAAGINDLGQVVGAFLFEATIPHPMRSETRRNYPGAFPRHRAHSPKTGPPRLNNCFAVTASARTAIAEFWPSRISSEMDRTVLNQHEPVKSLQVSGH
jgi:uncharacterized membrane protein